MHYCPICNNGMKEYNNYGYRTLNCSSCGQEIAYGYKNPERDKEWRGRSKEAINKEHHENKMKEE